MSGLDKIIEHIESSANENAAAILEAGREEAAKTLARIKAEADEKAAVLSRQSAADVASANKRIQSEAELTEKRFILNAKTEAVSGVISSAREKLENMEDGEYFETILKMVKKYASAKEGIIRFSEADLKRLPADFEASVNSVLKGGKLTLSKDAAKIDGGFILDYGDIEENCSFDALFEGLKESLQDKIGQMLFEE